MKKIIFIVLLLVLVVGCQKTIIEECTAPQVKLNGKCCLDANANYYCDDSEPKEPPIVQPAEPPVQEPAQTPGTLDAQALEKGIYDAYYPLYRYEFSDEFRFNVSGFEASYGVRKADRLRILSLKEVQDFSLFVKQKHETAITSNNAFAPERIAQKQDDPRWKDASFEYSHSLEEEGSSLVQEHLLLFEKNKDAVDVEFEYSLYVKCTDDTIVQISPLDSWKFDYSPKYAAATVKKEIAAYIENNRPKLIEDMSKIRKVCSGERVESGIEAGTIELNAKEFIPQITTIKAGEALKIQNNINSNVVLIFTREKPRKQFVSPIVYKNSVGVMVIDEPGNYSYFINGFNPKGKVEVI